MTQDKDNTPGTCTSVLADGNNRYTEPDEDFRRRIANKYGMWGAFLSVVMESKGSALDDCGRHLGLQRIIVDLPDSPCIGSCSGKGDK